MYLHSLISALDRGQWPVSYPNHFSPRERTPGFNAQEAGWAPEPMYKEAKKKVF